MLDAGGPRADGVAMSTSSEAPTARSQAMSGGSATSGGIEFQARVIAYVAAYALAGRPLKWCETESPVVPVAVSAETGGPGDDVRIELNAPGFWLEVQAKRGLRADWRLDEAIDRFATGLAANPGMIAILAVDPTASRSVRVHLREDLRRVEQGRTDGLRPVTQELLRRLGQAGLAQPLSVAGRIYVVQLDVEEDSGSDHGRALDALSSLVAAPELAAVAWTVLVAEGVRLSSMRGRRTINSLARLLESKNIELRADTGSGVQLAYQRWVAQITTAFRIPGLETQLPIETAWISLQALTSPLSRWSQRSLQEALRKYHEWERLSRENRGTPVQDVVELGQRVVVVGGPGAGKSTLCRRTAYRLTGEGEVVLWVRLPAVLRRCENGESIDEAIVNVALDGFDPRSSALRALLRAPDCLLADGLDECGAQAGSIAESLSRWASARPKTRLVVTTRPVGYDPGWFSGWTHVELLPLDPDRLATYAEILIRAVVTDETEAAGAAQRFQNQLAANRSARVAARNPLLLGFMLYLSLSGVVLGRSRADLYEQVTELMRTRAAPERSEPYDDVLTRRSLELMGWELIQDPTLVEESLRRRVRVSLLEETGMRPLDAERAAASCIEAWQACGVLERLQVGPIAIVTFIHPTLAEYAAARRAATLGDADLLDWLVRVRRDPRWRQVILLAAGAGVGELVVRLLLELDGPGDVTATEPLLAAAALDEMESSPDLLRVVVTRLVERLESPVPVVAFEAADAASGLVPRVPEAVRPRMHDLLHHPQYWTRLAAMKVALSLPDELIDVDILEQFFDEPPGGPPEDMWDSWRSLMGARRTSVWDAWSDVIERGAGILARLRPRPSTGARLERLIAEKRISTAVHDAVAGALAVLGRPEARDDAERWQAESAVAMVRALANGPEADRAILEGILRVTSGPADDQLEPRKPVALSRFIWGLDFPGVPVGDWLRLHRREDLAAVDAVFQGAITALGLDPRELRRDAAWALDHLRATPSDVLIRFIPRVDAEPDWSQVKGGMLPAEVLVRALAHPSFAIAGHAAVILASGGGGAEAPALVEELMGTCGDETMRLVSRIAEPLWGHDALNRILARLEQNVTAPCRWLLDALPGLPGAAGDDRVLPRLFEALASDNSMLAAKAAAALRKLPVIKTPHAIEQVQELMKRWTATGAACERCSIVTHSGHCPKCYAAVDNPRADLLAILTAADRVGIDALVELCEERDRDVAREASQALSATLSADPRPVSNLLRGVRDGALPVAVADAVLRLPYTLLAQHRVGLSELALSESVSVRQRLLGALSGAGWLTREEAIEIARPCLSDPSPDVRTKAAQVLRVFG
jgi:hypothetical protein